MESRKLNQIEVYGIEQILKEKLTEDCKYFCSNKNWFTLFDNTIVDNVQDDYYNVLHSVTLTEGNDFVLHFFNENIEDSIYYLSSVLNLDQPKNWEIINKVK